MKTISLYIFTLLLLLGGFGKSEFEKDVDSATSHSFHVTILPK